MDLDKTLKMLREERGICQKELALYLNVTIGTVSNYENGIHSPDLDTLCRLADFYGVSTDYLLGRTRYRAAPPTLDQPIYRSYTLGDLYGHLCRLPEKERYILVSFLSLLFR